MNYARCLKRLPLSRFIAERRDDVKLPVYVSGIRSKKVYPIYIHSFKYLSSARSQNKGASEASTFRMASKSDSSSCLSAGSTASGSLGSISTALSSIHTLLSNASRTFASFFDKAGSSIGVSSSRDTDDSSVSSSSQASTKMTVGTRARNNGKPHQVSSTTSLIQPGSNATDRAGSIIAALKKQQQRDYATSQRNIPVTTMSRRGMTPVVDDPLDKRSKELTSRAASRGPRMFAGGARKRR